MKTAVERLEELLEKNEAELGEKDREITGLQEKIESLECELRGAREGWRREEVLPREQELPVPRLELQLTRVDEWTRIWSYRIVRKFFAGDIVATPIGNTTIQGGSPENDLYREGPNAGKLVLPHRDGAHICHDMAHLNLPGFAVFGDHVDDLSSLGRQAARSVVATHQHPRT